MKGKKIPFDSYYYVKEMKERLRKSVRINENGCWIWTGCFNQNGYGVIRARGRNYLSHRLSFELFKEIDPENKYLCHKCDVPSCINPEHLFMGNQLDNLRDASKKKRMKHGSKHYISKLNEENIREIKKLLEIGFTQSRIAEIFNVDASSINKIKQGKTWKHELVVNI